MNNITPTSAIRVWTGFKLGSMLPSDFYRALGDTFVPGTLYMLRPLGINAYNVTVVQYDNENIPQECALIVYRSRDAYRAITRENLQGRVHRASHYAIFDMQRSKASFPDKYEPTSIGTDTFYLFDKDVDWQKGQILFNLFTVDQPSADFNSNIPILIDALQDYLKANGVIQAIIVLREHFITLWSYSEISDRFTSNFEDIRIGLAKLLEGYKMNVHKMMLSQTFPSYNGIPELMYLDKDIFLQYKYKVDDSSLIY